jgi:hypothetical protein
LTAIRAYALGTDLVKAVLKAAALLLFWELAAEVKNR